MHKEFGNFENFLYLCAQVSLRMHVLTHIHNTRVWMTVLLMMAGIGFTYAQNAAGTTADRATRVTDAVTLTVQSGSNYIRIEPDHLPATVIYTPDTAFGPLPTAMVMDVALPVEQIFEDCKTIWKWTVSKAENTQIVEIKAHEDATIHVDPFVCPSDQDTTAVAFDSFTWRGTKYTSSQDVEVEVQVTEECHYIYTLHLTIHNTIISKEQKQGCESFEWQGKIYTESGTYPVDTVLLPSGDRQINMIELTIGHANSGETTLEVCNSYTAPWGTKYTKSGDYTGTIKNASGCDSTLTVHLTVKDCAQYETIYFCEGFNTEHDEYVSDDYVRLYRPYVFESPATWNYMEGVILQTEHSRAKVDFRRAEQNLRNHYVGELVPVEVIRWSYRPDGSMTYQTLNVGTEPQWVETGTVALYVQFLCGQRYNSDFTTDIIETQVDVQPIKQIENGRLVIIRGGEKFDVLGNAIR